MRLRKIYYSDGSTAVFEDDVLVAGKMPAARHKSYIAGDRHYAGIQATDGTDISTRKKHKDYMKEKGYTTVDDFTQTWTKAAEQRADFYQGKDPSRKAEVERAFYNEQNKRRP